MKANRSGPPETSNEHCGRPPATSSCCATRTTYGPRSDSNALGKCVAEKVSDDDGTEVDEPETGDDEDGAEPRSDDSEDAPGDEPDAL